jgi:hypothetical protein
MRCWYCGVVLSTSGYLGTKRTKDHVIPRWQLRGASSDTRSENLVAACHSCNIGLKGGQPLPIFRQHLRTAFASWDGLFHGERPDGVVRPFAPVEAGVTISGSGGSNLTVVEDEYRTVFAALRAALTAYDAGDETATAQLAGALTRAGELIRAQMLRTRAECRGTGSLRAGRKYLEEADAERVRLAAEILQCEPPLRRSDSVE